MDSKSGNEGEPVETKEVHTRVVRTDEWVGMDPIDTPQAFDAYKRKLQMRYGHQFSDESQFDLFCMLPVSDAQKEQIVQSAIAARQAHSAIRTEFKQ